VFYNTNKAFLARFWYHIFWLWSYSKISNLSILGLAFFIAGLFLHRIQLYFAIWQNLLMACLMCSTAIDSISNQLSTGLRSPLKFSQLKCILKIFWTQRLSQPWTTCTRLTNSIELVLLELCRHDRGGVGNPLSLLDVDYRPLIKSHASIVSQFPVFCLASLLNSKLDLAHSTKYFTSSNCNSMQISRKSYVRLSKYTQLNF